MRLNIVRWMKEELKLTPNDTVVVKMDIEGAEWQVLRGKCYEEARPLRAILSFVR